MSNEIKEQKEKLLQLVKDTVMQDTQLREQYKMGEKFRFIRDRLNALLATVEESLASLQKETEKKPSEATADELFVYVHLFNAQGLTFRTWQKMIHPSVLYEYSVNRPIYTEKADIEAFIRGKPNKVQHGFITIIVKKQNVLTGEQAKDMMGHPLIKVREGSLDFSYFVSFTHNGNDYIVNEDGELQKK